MNEHDREVLAAIVEKYGRDVVVGEIKRIKKKQAGRSKFAGDGEDVWIAAKSFQRHLARSGKGATARSMKRVCELLEQRQSGLSSSPLVGKTIQNTVTRVEKLRAKSDEYRRRTDAMLENNESIMALCGGWEGGAVILPGRLRGKSSQ